MEGESDQLRREADKNLAEKRKEITPDGDFDLSLQMPGSDQSSDSDLEEESSNQEEEISYRKKQAEKSRVQLQISNKEEEKKEPQNIQLQKVVNQSASSEENKDKKYQGSIAEWDQDVQKGEGEKDEAEKQERWSDEQPAKNENQKGERPKRERPKRERSERINQEDEKQFIKRDGFEDERGTLNTYDHPADSKYIFAVHLLFMKELKQLVPKEKGYIKCNPRINSHSIKICYKDEEVLRQIQKKLEDFIDSIEVLEIPKKDADSGVTLSQKYKESLEKHKLAIFTDPSTRYKSQSTYICGKVTKKQLMLRLNEIRKINFTWLHLFKIPDTRSHKKILRTLFEQPEMKQLVHEKFNAREIEVRMPTQNQLNFQGKKKQGTQIILTIPGQKKLTIHQEIQETIVKFIRQTYFLFCFTFQREKLDKYRKFVPEHTKIIMFYIHQRNLRMSYLFVIVKQVDYKEVKQNIIHEILQLNLNLKGIRYFKSFCPSAPEKSPTGYRIQKYPKIYPYSWTLFPENRGNLDINRFLP